MHAFRLGELLARIRVQVRRTAPDGSSSGPLVVGHLTVDRHAYRAFWFSTEIELRTKEFELLAALVSQAGHVVTREQLMVDVWDEHWFGSTKTLDVHIAALRRKLSWLSGGTDVITTVRGVGYRYELYPLGDTLATLTTKI